MKQPWLKVLLGLGLAATLSAPAWAANPAQPGSINYVEGRAFLGSQPLSPNSVSSTIMQQGQAISTANGRAEVLLTPGVFLRLDHNSKAVLVSPSLSDTDVQLSKGRASVEVAQLYKENDLRINQDDSAVTLKKTGLYFFNAGKDRLHVVKGEALVSADGKDVKVTGDRVLRLNAAPEKSKKFDKHHFAGGDFYRWNSLRSKYLAEANVDEAKQYAYSYWPGTGWYWDPWFDAYTFIPGDGIFYSPFGWGFYSPVMVYRAPAFFDFDDGPYYHTSPMQFRDWDHDSRFAHTFVSPQVNRPHPVIRFHEQLDRDIAMRERFGGFRSFGGFRGEGGFHGAGDFHR